VYVSVFGGYAEKKRKEKNWKKLKRRELVSSHKTTIEADSYCMNV
jgi:hypothetical protein